jgi:hypothetical protein
VTPLLGFAVSSEVPEAPIIAEMAAALLCQLRRVEHRWAGYSRMTAGPAILRWTSVVDDPMPDLGFARVHVVNSIPEAPNDLAYHSVSADGMPFCRIGWQQVRAEGGALTGPNGLLSAISHEVAEACVDPDCTLTAAMPDGTRTSLEVCDWVQGLDYEELPDHYVAAVVGPEFFVIDAQPAGLCDGRVWAPFILSSGGYHDVIAADGTTSLVFGAQMHPAKRARIERTGVRGGMKARR